MAQEPSAPTPVYLPEALPLVVEPTPRWIRVRFGGTIIADSKRALLLIQYGPGGMPTYYFPQADVRMDALEPVTARPSVKGMVYYHVRVGDRAAKRAAWVYRAPPPALAALRGYVSFAWGAMEAWYEEAEEVFVHARDPYKRVDVLAGSRHVRVVINGETVADTRRPALLFETSLPTRYYIPQEDVRMDLLEPTRYTTRCPYKGTATYWSARIGDHVEKDVVWCYADPIPECPKIKGLLCFFNERVDLYVDGELQARPLTPWSR
jgi:uncharacterized protein (DUF427 family)